MCKSRGRHDARPRSQELLSTRSRNPFDSFARAIASRRMPTERSRRDALKKEEECSARWRLRAEPGLDIVSSRIRSRTAIEIWSQSAPSSFSSLAILVLRFKFTPLAVGSLTTSNPREGVSAVGSPPESFARHSDPRIFPPLNSSPDLRRLGTLRDRGHRRGLLPFSFPELSLNQLIANKLLPVPRYGLSDHPLQVLRGQLSNDLIGGVPKSECWVQSRHERTRYPLFAPSRHTSARDQWRRNIPV
jgi:hypothetical protein